MTAPESSPKPAAAAIARRHADIFLQGPRPTMSQFFRAEDCLKAQQDLLAGIILEAAARINALGGEPDVAEGKPGCQFCGGTGLISWTAGDLTKIDPCGCKAHHAASTQDHIGDPNEMISTPPAAIQRGDGQARPSALHEFNAVAQVFEGDSLSVIPPAETAGATPDWKQLAEADHRHYEYQFKVQREEIERLNRELNAFRAAGAAATVSTAVIEKLEPIFIIEDQYAGKVRLIVDFRGDAYEVIKDVQARILDLAEDAWRTQP